MAAKIRRPKATPKPRQKPGKREPVEPASIQLDEGRGAAGRGGGPGGHYWHIRVGEQRAGYVYINVIEDAQVGPHASIQIQINQPMQGRGIGRIAYRLACEASGHDVIYAHMRKSNLASRRAAELAGFREHAHTEQGQLILRWDRSSFHH
jgi:RimJ/RimL family protein N-acetyltransferase